MRVFFPILCLLIISYGCENQITTVGQEHWDNPTTVEIKRVVIDDASTVRLDSFPTSTSVYGYNLKLPQTVLGGMTDLISGRTETISYFYPAPSTLAYFDYEGGYVYDSLTLHITSPKIIAGDTLDYQRYHLYRVPEIPSYDLDYPYFFSNNAPLLGERIAELVLFPEEEYLKNPLYFRIEGTLGQELYDMIVRQDERLEPGNEYDFQEYFRGLAIVPDAANSTFMSVDPTFELRCYYHLSSAEDVPLYAAFRNSTGEPYTFTHVRHTPSTELIGTTYRNSLPFYRYNFGVIQGLNGYLFRLKLPYLDESAIYRFMVRVEIELRPRLENYDNIPQTPSLHLYYTDEHDRLQRSEVAAYRIEGKGSDNERYLVDITQYYKDKLRQGDHDMHLMLGLPGRVFSIQDAYTSLLQESFCFDRFIINEEPALIITTIQYRH